MMKWWSRGNLNLAFIILIFIINIRFDFELEYQMEYLAKLHATSPPICIRSDHRLYRN